MPYWRSGDDSALVRARDLRRGLTWAEIKLWNRVKHQKLGFKFRRQHPFRPYVLDFYCAEARLAVELDGPSHDERGDADLRRDAYLMENGIETLRLANAASEEECGD